MMDNGGTVETYALVEQELCRIPDVTAARIVADSTGRPVEVHILASPAKAAKQIVRDVQSVAMATFGLDLDRRIISVVQLDTMPAPGGVAPPEPGAADPPDVALTNGHRAPPPAPVATHRIVVDGVTAVRNGMDCSVQVALRREDDLAVGVTEGLVVSGSAQRLVASATLSALRQFEPAASRAEVETAILVRVGERMVAVASVVFLVPPYEEVVSGSAMVRSAGGEYDATARAVLDATNRRLAQLASP